MLKSVDTLRSPDPYFAGTAGFVGSSLEAMHRDVNSLELPDSVPEAVRRCHNAIRHAYIYSFYSYDLLTVAAAQTLPCLELAFRLKLGPLLEARHGRKRPAMLGELLRKAREAKLIDEDAYDLDGLKMIRNMFAHGSDTVLNPPLFLTPFEAVTSIIARLFEKNSEPL